MMSKHSQLNKKPVKDNRPLRVLQIGSRMACGGAETRLMELFRISNQDNVRFDFCVVKKEPGYYDSEIKALGGQILQCPLTKNILQFLGDVNEE